MTVTRDLNRPEYNRCDYCGRNPHKVAIRRDPAALCEMQRKENERAVWKRRKPLRIWPVVGLCPSCFADGEADDRLPRGTILYDLRAKKS